MVYRRLALAAAMALCLAAHPAVLAAEAPPYTVAVWARVLFGTDGKALDYTLVDEAKYPAPFAENVKSRLARASIQPPEVQGQPATLRSGVELSFTVTPSAAGGTVRLDSLILGALPTRQFFAPYPQDLAQTPGWEGEAVGSCTVSTDGRCKAISFPPTPVMPESVRRFVRLSLDKWEFEPQQVGGVPIEGHYELRVKLNTVDGAIEDFREDKFDRLIKRR